jgi:hypothetical protein
MNAHSIDLVYTLMKYKIMIPVIEWYSKNKMSDKLLFFSNRLLTEIYDTLQCIVSEQQAQLVKKQETSQLRLKKLVSFVEQLLHFHHHCTLIRCYYHRSHPIEVSRLRSDWHTA